MNKFLAESSVRAHCSSPPSEDSPMTCPPPRTGSHTRRTLCHGPASLPAPHPLPRTNILARATGDRKKACPSLVPAYHALFPGATRLARCRQSSCTRDRPRSRVSPRLRDLSEFPSRTKIGNPALVLVRASRPSHGNLVAPNFTPVPNNNTRSQHTRRHDLTLKQTP
jgi:hypothetical protein